MSILIHAKTADIWAGGGVIGFITANAVQLEPIMHFLAESATLAVAVIAIIARFRTNKKDGK